MQSVAIFILAVVFLNVRVEVTSTLWWGDIMMLIQY